MIILLRSLQLIFSLIFRLPAPIAVYLMRFAGETTYRIARLTPIKGIAARNVNRLFPDADGRKVADKLLRNIAYSIFEVLCTPFFNETHINLICKVNGRENIDLSLAKRKGAVILTMHTGNYEMIPVVLASLGYKLNSVLKAADEPIFRFLSRSRSYRGIKLINVLEANMYRESLRALGENEIIALAADTGALEGKHELFPFLGRRVPVATGWLTLAQRSEAAVIPTHSKREEQKLVITFGEPLQVYADNREEAMHKVGQFYENFIRNHPEQWAMFLNDYETKRMVEGK